MNREESSTGKGRLLFNEKHPLVRWFMRDKNKPVQIASGVHHTCWPCKETISRRVFDPQKQISIDNQLTEIY